MKKRYLFAILGLCLTAVIALTLYGNGLLPFKPGGEERAHQKATVFEAVQKERERKSKIKKDFPIIESFVFEEVEYKKICIQGAAYWLSEVVVHGQMRSTRIPQLVPAYLGSLVETCEKPKAEPAIVSQ
jgi:hypothetical protein